MGAAPTQQSLLDANERFYRVFEALDFPAMAEMWEQGDRAFCVHPGWPPLYGSASILDSWRRIIANTNAMRFTLTRVEAVIEGNLGVVTVFENISQQVEGERHSSGAVSTNLFAWDGQGWKIFHHHAAPAPLPHAEDADWLN